MARPVDAIVLVVDDDAAMRESLVALLESADLQCEAFPSPEAFLHHPRPETPACLILDVQLPGLSGLDLQTELANGEPPLPIVFLTGHGTIPMSVKAMKGGAVEFLTKPFEPDALLAAVRLALDRDRDARARLADLAGLRARYATLTAREREVLAHVVTGKLNKQIAGELGTSEQTIKVHRGRVMRKMAVGSVAELVKAAQRIGGAPK